MHVFPVSPAMLLCNGESKCGCVRLVFIIHVTLNSDVKRSFDLCLLKLSLPTQWVGNPNSDPISLTTGLPEQLTAVTSYYREYFHPLT